MRIVKFLVNWLFVLVLPFIIWPAFFGIMFTNYSENDSNLIKGKEWFWKIW